LDASSSLEWLDIRHSFYDAWHPSCFSSRQNETSFSTGNWIAYLDVLFQNSNQHCIPASLGLQFEFGHTDRVYFLRSDALHIPSRQPEIRNIYARLENISYAASLQRWGPDQIRREQQTMGLCFSNYLR